MLQQRRALKNQAAAMGTNPWEAAQILARTNGGWSNAIKETPISNDGGDDDDPWDSWDKGDEGSSQGASPVAYPVYQPTYSTAVETMGGYPCAAIMGGSTTIMPYTTGTIARPTTNVFSIDQSNNRMPDANKADQLNRPLNLKSEDLYRQTGYAGSQLYENVQTWLLKHVEAPVAFNNYGYRFYYNTVAANNNKPPEV